MKCLAALLALLAAQSALAQVDPIVRVQVEPRSVRVGEALSLRVTVLVPTFFLRPPAYPDFEVANAITRLPSNTSYATSERVGGESWSGIVREYRIYPLAGGNYRIDGTALRVTYSDPGGALVVREVPVPDVAFTSTVPAGAERLDPYIAGRSLELSLEVDGGDEELAAGDAVVLTYRAALVGLPSVFLPPLAAGLDAIVRADAVTVYADAPRFEDKGGIASRTERVTLVFNAGGEFRVPAIAIDYWNTDAEMLRTARTETLRFSVTGPATAQSAATDSASDNPGRWLVALLAGVFLLALAASRRAWLPALRDRLGRWRASEAYAFRQLRRDLKTRGQAGAYRRVQRWLERLEPGLGLRAFADGYGDAALRADVGALSDQAFGGRQAAVDLQRLEYRLVDARQRYLSQGQARRGTRLVPLNP